jgi:hypothetical protein
MPEVESQINQYIETYTSDELKFKGERLYGAGLVDFKVYEENTDTWKFFVQDAQIFRITIRGVNKNEIEAKCTCSYGWGGVCKHAVASLLYIADRRSGKELPQTLQEKKASSDSITSNLMRSNEGGSLFELIDYEFITNQFIKNNVSERVFYRLNYLTHFIELIRVDIAQNKVVFKIENDGTSVDVKIHSEKGKVYISSTEYSQTGQLTLSSAYCLMLIANSATPEMLADVFSAKLAEKEQQILSNFGLSKSAIFTAYFKHAFNKDAGMFVKRTAESKGMIPVLHEEMDPFKSFINRTSSKELVLEGLISTKEKREFGFVLRHIVDSTNEDEDFFETHNFLGNYEIIPIIGKTNKGGSVLNGNIEEYALANDYQINKSENSKELLHLLSELKGDSGSPLAFQLKKRAFSYLANEKYIFGLKPHTFNIKKSNLQSV